jgi:hypothetical protein
MEYLVTLELTIMLKRFRFFLWLISISLALMLNTAHAAFSCVDTTTTGIPRIEELNVKR